MTLNQLQYFCKVAEFENYRAASETVHVSQPSLSRSIASLEEELGISLFDKKGRGVILTKAGRIFYEKAIQIVNACRDVESRMIEMSRGGGKIDIGYIFPLAGRFIPHRVRSFLDLPGNESIKFSFWQSHTPAIMKRIESGNLDVGFGGYTDKTDLNYFPVETQEFVIITPKNHPLADQNEISIEEYARHPIIGYDRQSWMGIHTLALYEEFNVNPEIVVECPDEYTILSLVRENFGIALIPRTDTLDEFVGINVHSIKGYNLAHQIYMFWMKDREQLPVVERFIAYMKELTYSQIDSDSTSKVYLKDIIHYDSFDL
ncbi:LysR family transcriptional regulator [Erysipelotrichaceae bacterium 51-3]